MLSYPPLLLYQFSPCFHFGNYCLVLFLNKEFSSLCCFFVIEDLNKFKQTQSISSQ
jgi:hypothetical protein